MQTVLKSSKIKNADDIRSFSEYMKEIYRYRILSRDETELLFREYRNGNMEARDKLIAHNLRLVLSVANLYRGKGLALEDLIQEGNIGLMKVLDRYNPDLGFAFSTYAYHWIRQCICRALDLQSKEIRIPGHRFVALGKALKEIDNFIHEHGVEPTQEQTKAIIGMPYDVFMEVKLMMTETISLDEEISGEDSTTKKELLVDSTSLGPAEELEQKAMYEEMYALVNHLKGQMREVMIRRYGFDGHQPQTMMEVGKHFHVSRQRIQQVEKRALCELRKQILKQHQDGNLQEEQKNRKMNG